MARPLTPAERASRLEDTRLLTARGATATEIAKELAVSSRTVERWRAAFDWTNPLYHSTRRRSSRA